MRVLLVEDERKVADAWSEGLRSEGYDVHLERTGDGAFFRAVTEPFDLLLMDLGLPGRDGLDVITAIRGKNIVVPIIVLTARDTVSDRVRGLDAGADDYLIKPFAFAELLARMRVLLRRDAPERRDITVGLVTLDLVSRRVKRDGKSIDLTGREFDLFAHLMRHEGQVVPREALVREVWGEPARTTPLDNVIDVHMARLRHKVQGGSDMKLIHTIRGIGYMVRDGE